MKNLSEERNDSGEYLILLNDEFYLECKVIEKEFIDSFHQKITTEFYFDKDKSVTIKNVTLLDKQTKSIVSFRLLPRSFKMFFGDTLNLTWVIKIDDNRITL